jgi:putative CocE/NonD family hydrolase
MKESWIGMPDGVRLAADLYVPAGDVKEKTFPVLLEYLPYRKTESRARNHALYSYFVERGYVVARVDIRGTGNSEGRLIPHEYSNQEHQDGIVVIDWLSKQPWSNGNVGMFGISWGGFNSIQMARLNPPALKAIIAVDATEDLYQDDVHFMDGIMHLDSWEMSQDLDNARPGAPDYVIDEAYFRDRFDTQPWMMTYKRQQRDGPFWDRASARGQYEAIKIPTFHIGGWYDGYRDSLPRMLESLKAPVKAMIGAWSHAWPHNPYPEPGMEWRHEAVRWFDQWLKGVDTGIMDEPRFAVYVRKWHPPGPYLEHAPGLWRWEEGWPIERIKNRVMYPQPNHTLSPEKPESTEHRLRYLPTIGYEAGGPVMWWGDVAHDQRGTDAFSLVYDSEPLSEDTEILGLPRAVLRVATSANRANWFVRLSDVAPNGTVTQVAGAGFNGTHRRSAREPEDIEPGRVFPLEIEMHFTSWVFPKGHRIRLSVNNAQWPMLSPGLAGGAAGPDDGSGIPAAHGKPEAARLRKRRHRHQLGLRRDLLRRSEPADRRGHHHRNQFWRLPLPLGHGGLPGNHRTQHLGCSPGKHSRARHSPHGGHPEGPCPGVGSRAILHQRPRQLPLPLHPQARKKRRAGEGKDLERHHTQGLPINGRGGAEIARENRRAANRSNRFVGAGF